MRWMKVELNTGRARETIEGRKSPGRIGGILGPGKRWGHTCNAIKGGRFIYVFGGYGKDNCQTNDVHVYDTIKQAWSKPMVKGVPPSPRDSHTCTTVGNNLFVFGGTDGKKPLKDLHILDTSSNTWVSPSLRGEGPDAREGHSAALVDKRLFIFGGCGKSCDDPEEVYYNDLYILDTESFVWKRAITSGTLPSARDSHTCSTWKKKIIVIGGEDASDYYLSDVHILDADTFVWKELHTSGEILTPRAGHSTVALGKNLFVFGGFTDDRNLYDDLHVLNVDTGIWSKVINAGQGPSSRFSVAGDCLDPWKGVLVFIGGCNENLEALDDMYNLYTDMSFENGRDEQRQEKFSFRRELQKRRQEQFLPVDRSINDKDAPKIGMCMDRSVNDKDAPKIGMSVDRSTNDKDVPKIGMSDSCQSVPLPSYGQAGKQNELFHTAGKQKLTSYEYNPAEKKTFDAKITSAVHYGYTVETVIDGKTLHGILFPCQPSSTHVAYDYLNGGQGVEANNVKSSNNDKPKVKIAGSSKQTIEKSDGKAVHGKESTPQASPVEPHASNSNNSAPVDVGQPHMAVDNSEPRTIPSIDLKDDDPPQKPSREGPYENPSST
eukprot:TRINITY_DN1531_c0_g4_i1.p1 TRINITY_DN1531_c0_g4~~TRINITY_DN1531_c0_g4_i1.p1  ORF type:complete len:604 (-),score=107.45 TRINITY_DN1531_c0_g4_i1:366-2177(-)